MVVPDSLRYWDVDINVGEVEESLTNEGTDDGDELGSYDSAGHELSFSENAYFTCKQLSEHC